MTFVTVARELFAGLQSRKGRSLRDVQVLLQSKSSNPAVTKVIAF